jgi:hypothetical protein
MATEHIQAAKVKLSRIAEAMKSTEEAHADYETKTAGMWRELVSAGPEGRAQRKIDLAEHIIFEVFDPKELTVAEFMRIRKRLGEVFEILTVSAPHLRGGQPAIEDMDIPNVAQCISDALGLDINLKEPENTNLQKT